MNKKNEKQSFYMNESTNVSIQAERFKTKGAKWFNMPATKKTEEINHDLEILQMRSALDRSINLRCNF